MPYYKFEKEDLIYSTVISNPKRNIIIFDGKVYIDDFVHSKSKFNNLLSSKQGSVSLYELNVDRSIDTTGEPPGMGSIYQFVSKDSTRTAFKTVSLSQFDNTSQYQYGDVIKFPFPLTASVTRVGVPPTAIKEVSHDDIPGMYRKVGTLAKRKILALRNVFEKYTHISPHYAYNSASYPYTQAEGNNYLKKVNWDKSQQQISLIEIPGILFGSSIKKGSVKLKYYITGTLAAELQDKNRNGELIQVSGTYNAATNNEKVAGVVLYNEGFIALTGSWNLNANFQDQYISAGTDTHPSWVYFGIGANDALAPGVVTGSAFQIEYEGVSIIPTLTMFAHAPKNALNNSTNPTFIDSTAKLSGSLSERLFHEPDIAVIKHMSHSRFHNQTGSFEKQTYISQIGIYDQNDNLIAIAKLANPVRKTESRDLTFKLKLDF